MELQALPARIGQVRRIVSAQLRYWHLDPLIEPAALGVTELLTNVHRHARPDKHCTVELTLLLDRLTVSVRDRDPRLPRVAEADPVSTHGRGLTMVAAVSESWGTHARDDGGGKVVWFTLPVPEPAGGGTSPHPAQGAGRAAAPERRGAPPDRKDPPRPAAEDRPDARELARPATKELPRTPAGDLAGAARARVRERTPARAAATERATVAERAVADRPGACEPSPA